MKNNIFVQFLKSPLPFFLGALTCALLLFIFIFFQEVKKNDSIILLSNTPDKKPSLKLDMDSLFSALTYGNNLHFNKFTVSTNEKEIFENNICSTSFSIFFDDHSIKYKGDCSDGNTRSFNNLYFDNIKITHFITETNDTVKINEFNDFAVEDTTSVFFKMIDPQNELILLQGYSFISSGRYRLIGSTILLHKFKNQCFAYLFTTYIGIGSYLSLLKTNQIIYLNIETDQVYQVDEPIELTVKPIILNLQNHQFSSIKNKRNENKFMNLLAIPTNNGYKVEVIRYNWDN